jgi:hypothetical protein
VATVHGVLPEEVDIVKTPVGRLLPLAALVFAPLIVTPVAGAASPTLPDLRMTRVTRVTLDTTTIADHRLLRYTARIVNVGAGPFETNGTRSSTTESTMPVTQTIYDSDGGTQSVPTIGTMYWGGDGHNHWHITDLEGGVLTRLDNGLVVGTSAKHGFHGADNTAWDLTLPGAPQSKVYLACGGSSCDPSVLSVKEGLSVGWMDTYAYSAVFQWIDITGLKNGKYMLTMTADPNRYFAEADATNNSASATLRIGSGGVKILSRSGGA